MVAIRRGFESPINPLGRVIELLTSGEFEAPSHCVMCQDEIKFFYFV